MPGGGSEKLSSPLPPSQDQSHSQWRLERVEAEQRELRHALNQLPQALWAAVNELRQWQAGASERERSRDEVQRAIREEVRELRHYVSQEIAALRESFSEDLKALRRETVSQEQWWPVRTLVYGMVSIMLGGALVAITRLILK